uniref:G-protein coupled receptors family 2 profile 2 domain-containing protein n=1 Tax=Photinus pyralis TaxID=7054 RepID=A0A1Y1NNN9_PHOPY
MLRMASKALVNYLWLTILIKFVNTIELQHYISHKPEIKINKCCEPFEILLDDRCTHINKTNETIWHPMFTSENGKKQNVQVDYIIVTGNPDCGSMQIWHIYYYQESTDVLQLLPNGALRHYPHYVSPEEDLNREIMYHDYPPGKYCMEKHVKGSLVSEYASVCAPEHRTDWTSSPFLMRNIISPITHGISMACFLTIAIIYFIMPTLRDLVGNIITTICVCLIVSQAADTIRLLTVFTNHVSIIAAETLCYIALLGSFFWLNSLGYYVWKTFKSRNVFLRITDGKKYCYYSAYAWSCTIVMGALALFAHYTMDYQENSKSKFEYEQETIGSLGIIIFFVPVSFTVLVNVFFFVTTLKILNRMNTYGRIHHKLKHSFRMFLLLFLVMTLTWLFFLLSFTRFEGLVYCYIVINALQAPLFLYICVVNQAHVAFLVQKTCCYTNCACACCKPNPECEWGDEMTAMNTGAY